MKPTHLVTGGCGFVGRHLVHALLAQGANVTLIDDLSTGLDPALWLPERFAPLGGARYADAHGQTVTFYRGDLMRKLLGQLDGTETPWPKFADVFHLASIVGGRSKIDGDPLHVGVDLAIDALFFRWLTAAAPRAERVLYASSSAAYPIDLQAEGRHVALREDMLDMGQGKLGQPDMSYGFSKMTGEYLAHLAASHYGVHVACVRPFSGYGEDQEPVYPVPAIAGRVAAGEEPVTVWGTGEQGRDFVHIDDCIAAMLLAIERIGDGSAVNIGTGKLTCFRDLAQLFLQLAGRPEGTVRPLIGKPVGVASRYSDPSYMQARLGFTPRVSLHEGMGRVLRAAQARLQAPPAETATGAGADANADTNARRTPTPTPPRRTPPPTTTHAGSTP